MADLYASRSPVRLNDGTADANNAAVLNTGPTTEYGLVVRNIPSGTQAVSFSGDVIVIGTDAHDAALTGDPLTVGGFASAAAPTGVSADGDAVRAWFLRNGAQATVLTAAGALIGGDATNGLDVDVTRVTGTVTVDSELNTAAALADAASASVSTATVGAVGLVMNATTLDRQRAVIHAQDTAGIGIAAAGILGEFDDAATASVTENQFAPVRISSRRALLVEGVASGTNLNVNLAASGATVTVDTELTAVAALADATANPTITNIAGFLMGFNGTTWDRVRTANTGRLQVDVVTGAAGTQYVGDAAATATPTGTMAMGLANAAAPSDVSANNDAVAQWMLRNGSAVMNLASGGTLVTLGQKVMASSLPVVLASDQSNVPTNLAQVAGTNTITGGIAGSQGVGGVLAHDAAAASAFPVGIGAFASAAAPTDVSADGDAVKAWALRNGSLVVNLAAGGTLITGGASGLLVDTELPAAAALADATANPTVPGVGGFLMGYNGTTWDRVRTANTGRLQVDVVSGGSSAPPSEIPTGYNMIDVYGSTSGTAAAGTATVVTNTPANTKLVYVRQVLISASGQTKGQLKFGATVKATFFTSPEDLTQVIRFDPPIPITGDGSTAVTVDVTNRELSAMDLYARLNAIVQA